MQMIKAISTLFIAVGLIVANTAAAGTGVVTVQSIRIPPYDQAIIGFSSVCEAPVEHLVISEVIRTSVAGIIEKKAPELILAVGLDALKAVRSVNKIPIVYVMVLNPAAALPEQSLATGVRMEVPPGLQLLKIQELLPSVKTVGLLYSSVKTGSLVTRAEDALRETGLKLLTEEIFAAGDVPSALMKLADRIDAFWMLPDVNVLTPQTIEFLMLFSLEQQIPVITFSPKYFETGAFMSIGLDAVDMGRQAGEIANGILRGTHSPSAAAIAARSVIVNINQTIAEKLNISVDEALVNGGTKGKAK